MSLPDHTPPLTPIPKEKRRIFYVLLAVGLLLLVRPWAWPLNSKDFTTILNSLGLSLTTIAGVELLPELLQKVERKRKRGRFREFFGSAAFENENPVRLLFPKRTIKKDLKTSPFELHLDASLERDLQGVKTEGVTGYLAYEDVLGAVHLSNTFREMTGKDVEIQQEHEPLGNKERDYCMISFGLGFTGATRWLEKHLEPPLFHIHYGESTREAEDGKRINKTDHFKVWNEDVQELQSIDMTELPENEDVALIVRIVPKAFENERANPWFICAGRTASGTAAAGWFLAKRWEVLYALYESQQKNLSEYSAAIVIEHKSGAGNKAWIRKKSPKLAWGKWKEDTTS